MEFIILSIFLFIFIVKDVLLMRFFIKSYSSNGNTPSFFKQNSEALTDVINTSNPYSNMGVCNSDGECLSGFADEEEEEEFNALYVERERLQRDARFEARMAAIREELGVSNLDTDVLSLTAEAEELHPLVHNLPHESVVIRNFKEGTEVAN